MLLRAQDEMPKIFVDCAAEVHEVETGCTATTAMEDLRELIGSTRDPNETNGQRKLLGYQILEDGICGPVYVEDDLAALQKAVNTNCIGIVRRRIGPERRIYSIVHDDEGLIKGRDVTAIYDTDSAAFVGDLLIFRDRSDGELDSLTMEDVQNISEHIRPVTRYFLELV